MEQLKKVSEQDREFLKGLTAGKSDDEKLQIVFDWFVENWGYSGYSKLAASYSNNLKKSFEQGGGIWRAIYRTLDITAEDKAETNFIKRPVTDDRAKNFENTCLDVMQWAANLNAVQRSKIIKKYDKNKKQFLLLFASVKRLNEVHQKDEAEKFLRERFIKKQNKKYIGVCEDFALEYASVCADLELGKKVLYCGGQIDNGVDLVAHAFNAVIDEKNNELKYIDLSYAIHAREQAEGFHGVWEDFHSENPQDFYLKTREEIEKAEGKPRVYNLTEQELFQKVKQTQTARTNVA